MVLCKKGKLSSLFICIYQPVFMEEIPRHQYLAELDEWRDETDIVKVILGVRRSGKSVVMGQYCRRLLESGVSSKNMALR